MKYLIILAMLVSGLSCTPNSGGGSEPVAPPTIPDDTCSPGVDCNPSPDTPADNPTCKDGSDCTTPDLATSCPAGEVCLSSGGDSTKADLDFHLDVRIKENSIPSSPLEMGFEVNVTNLAYAGTRGKEKLSETVSRVKQSFADLGRVGELPRTNLQGESFTIDVSRIEKRENVQDSDLSIQFQSYLQALDTVEERMSFELTRPQSEQFENARYFLFSGRKERKQFERITYCVIADYLENQGLVDESFAHGANLEGFLREYGVDCQHQTVTTALPNLDPTVDVDALARGEQLEFFLENQSRARKYQLFGVKYCGSAGLCTPFCDEQKACMNWVRTELIPGARNVLYKQLQDPQVGPDLTKFQREMVAAMFSEDLFKDPGTVENEVVQAMKDQLLQITFSRPASLEDFNLKQFFVEGQNLFGKELLDLLIQRPEGGSVFWYELGLYPTEVQDEILSQIRQQLQSGCSDLVDYRCVEDNLPSIGYVFTGIELITDRGETEKFVTVFL